MSDDPEDLRRAHISEIQLENRIKARRQPLRQQTHDEEKIRKDKLQARKVARVKQRDAQGLNSDKTTQKDLFGGEAHV